MKLVLKNLPIELADYTVFLLAFQRRNSRIWNGDADLESVFTARERTNG